ncbi:MAG: NADH-quinone oxidoreductase subunit N [Chloroflexota bacterium]|nr:NADH-quinone oxidoreductase subunit N [Dehalococcoidia bacterium]MDW8254869.1 NADH-quinone oxidoreductase subunit N [Chloroflexota bacterium]
MNGLLLLLPELLIGALAFLVFSADLLLPSRRAPLVGWIAAVGMLALALFCAAWWGVSGRVGDLYVVDRFAVLFKVLALLMGAAVVLMSVDYARRRLPGAGEYYGLIVFAVLGIVIMTGATELLTAYIGLELLNFSLYVLVSYRKWNPKSNEAGTKYILLGALSSAVLLYGLSLLYGIAGTTSYGGIAAALAGSSPSPALNAALVLTLGGLGFKVAAVPFHMWAPDAYEGAPTPITAFLAVAAKAAGFGLLLRLVAEALLPALPLVVAPLAAIATATMILGNTVAIRQRNIKRLLAYSSIGQVGYLLVGLAAFGAGAAEAIVVHLVGYAAASFAAFLVVVIVENRTGDEEIADYAGLAERAPFAAFALTAAFFSLTGLPLLAGFVTKFALFLAAAQAGWTWLVAIGITTSVVSLYYYLMVIRQLYVVPPAKVGALGMTAAERGLLAVLLAATIAIGVVPAPLFAVIQSAVAPLFS